MQRLDKRNYIFVAFFGCFRYCFQSGFPNKIVQLSVEDDGTLGSLLLCCPIIKSILLILREVTGSIGCVPVNSS